MNRRNGENDQYEILRIMGEEIKKAVEENGAVKLMEVVMKTEVEQKNKPKKNRKEKKVKNWEKNRFHQ